MERYTFAEHQGLLLVGVISGLISGLFFVLYSELKGQFKSTHDLVGVILFVLVFYYIIVLFVSYPVLKYFKKIAVKQKEDIIKEIAKQIGLEKSPASLEELFHLTHGKEIHKEIEDLLWKKIG